MVEYGIHDEVVQVSMLLPLMVGVVDKVLDIVVALQELNALLLTHNRYTHYLLSIIHTGRVCMQWSPVLY